VPEMPRPKNAPERIPTGGPDLYIEGGFLYFRPSFYPSFEVKEWGGRWDDKRKAWRLPRLVSTARDALSYGAVAPTEDVHRLLTPHPGGPSRIPHRRYEKAATEYVKLYDFQREAVHRLVTTDYHGQMLALSPGLGKTPVSLVAAQAMGFKYVLVVAPLSLVPNWEREFKKWLPDSQLQMDAMHQDTPYDDEGWTVTNYDTVRKLVDAYKKVPWDLVIYDESVLLKSRNAQRTMAAKVVADHAKHVWLLSGSPITRDYSDIWSQFNIIQPEYFTSFWRFTNRYCVVEQTEWGTQILGSRHGISIRMEFPEIMFVRNQEEVLPDLPKIIHQEYEVNLTKKQAKAHQDLVDDWVHRIESGEFEVTVSNVISELIRLQQVTSNLRNLETTGHPWPDESAKADVICDLLTTGEVEYPVLIWSHWRPGAAALRDRIEKLTKDKKNGGALIGKSVAHVMGGQKDNAEHIESFRTANLDVLIMSLGVGKYGHTLTDTRTAIYLDKTWDSDAYFQSLFRLERIGLNHRPIAISLRCKGTVDEFIEQNLAGKLPSMANVTGSDLVRLLSSLGPEYAGLPIP
jgi:non-specific serine/threonine protein kinase